MKLPGPLKVEEEWRITYGDPAFVASYLTTCWLSQHDNILMVSHLPLVGFTWLQSLCPAAGHPMFATSSIACISGKRWQRALLWLEGPHTIR